MKKKKKAGMTIQQFMDLVNRKNPNEPEFIQAVQEVVESLDDFIDDNPRYVGVLERMVEPERTIIFRVPWITDKGEFVINRGFIIEMNYSIGPYKG